MSSDEKKLEEKKLRFVRDHERRHLTGIERNAWSRLERQGKTPKRYQISPNAVGWLESEIEDWIKSRIQPSSDGNNGK